MTSITRDGDGPSVTDPETHFTVVLSGRGVPTGEIQCDECDAVGNGVAGIDHEPGCSQAGVE